MKKIGRLIRFLKGVKRYEIEKNKWKKKGGIIDHKWRIIKDYYDNAGTSSGHYFHQDLLVSNFIFSQNPSRHIDIGSRFDGFVAHVASFRKIEVMDIRTMPKSIHSNIVFLQKDLMSSNDLDLKTDSLSCLHTIEHFGLGRYGDEIDPNGHIKGINNMISLLNPGATFYISFPIGKSDKVYFNAHRVFHPETILSYESVKSNLKLERFDYVDDSGDLVLNSDINSIINVEKYGCGIYSFKMKR